MCLQCIGPVLSNVLLLSIAECLAPFLSMRHHTALASIDCQESFSQLGLHVVSEMHTTVSALSLLPISADV